MPSQRTVVTVSGDVQPAELTDEPTEVIINNIKEEVEISTMSTNIFTVGSGGQLVNQSPDLVALENIKAELDKIQDTACNIELAHDVPEPTKTEVVIEETANVKVEPVMPQVASILPRQEDEIATATIMTRMPDLSNQATTVTVDSDVNNLVTPMNIGVKRPASPSTSAQPQMKVIIQKNPTSGATQQVILAQSPGALGKLTMTPSGQGIIVAPGSTTPTKTITLSQAGIVSPLRTLPITTIPSTPPRIVPQQKIAISPAKTPTKITMIPVSTKSPHKIIQNITGGSSVLTMLPKNAILTTAANITGGTATTPATKTIALSPSKVVIKQPFITGKPSVQATTAHRQITIPIQQNTQNVQQIQVPGSKFNYIRLVSTPASQAQAISTGTKTTTIAPAVQPKPIIQMPVGNTSGQPIKIAVGGKPTGSQPVTSQRLLLPATTSVQMRTSTTPTAIRPNTTSASISGLPPGTALISTGGNVQGFALVPAQYISNLQQQITPAQPAAQPQQQQQTKQQDSSYIPIASNDLTMSNALSSRHLNGSNAMDAPGGQRPRKPCNCTKSQCLKLYCDCFANGEFCHNCNCTNCANNLEHEEERSRAIKSCLDRNPHAFHPKIGKGTGKVGDGDRRHNKGCNCKKSGCLKNYCECYEAKIMCSSMCRCVGCKNFEESPERKTLMHLADAAEVRVLQQSSVRSKLSSQMQDVPSRHSQSIAGERLPYTFITTEVAEATCVCMLAQAEEAERTRQPQVVHEKAILEEFGRCLMQIIESANRTKAGVALSQL